MTRWITINEPLVVSHNGYRIGVHAPGLCDDAAAAAATHHLLLGHGLAAAALRTVIPGVGRGGHHPQPDPGARRARRRTARPTALEQARLITDATTNGIFLEPLLSGRYPAHAPAHILPPAELIADGDMETIAAPLDFLGVNYYQPVHLRPGDPDHLGRDEEAPLPGIRGVVAYRPDGMEQTPMGWLIDPDGLYELLVRLAKDAPDLPLFITENGCAAEDYVTPEGVVYDIERIKYLHLHLDAVRPGGQGRGEPVRVLRLVAARQLRVGVRIPEAVRDRVRRLRHATQDPESQFRLLRRRSTRQRRPPAAEGVADVTGQAEHRSV